jgi:hypothetical protein
VEGEEDGGDEEEDGLGEFEDARRDVGRLVHGSQGIKRGFLGASSRILQKCCGGNRNTAIALRPCLRPGQAGAR